MGCGQSKERGAEHEHAARHPRRSQSAGNTALSDNDEVQPIGGRRQQPPTADATSEPLRPPTPLESSPTELLQAPPPWTRSMLEHQRRDFFETRVTGDPNAWQTIERICEQLRQTPPNVAEAQALLQAADLRCVRGRITINKGRNRRRGGVYDATGQLYALPPWVVTDPLDLVGEPGEKDGLDISSGAQADEDSEDEDLKAPQSPRQEKGKGRAGSPGRTLQVRCRRSDVARDHFVSYSQNLAAGTLMSPLEEKVGPDRAVRLYLGGKRLDLDKTLAQQGWKEGQVLNAFVSEQSAESA